MANPLPMLQRVGHHHQVGNPFRILPVPRLRRQRHRRQRLPHRPGQLPIVAERILRLPRNLRQFANGVRNRNRGHGIQRHRPRPDVIRSRRFLRRIGVSRGRRFAVADPARRPVPPPPAPPPPRLGRHPRRAFLDRPLRRLLRRHNRPIHQPGVNQLDVPPLGGPGHQLLEPRKPQLLFVKGRIPPHQPLLDRRQQRIAPGRPLIPDDFLDGPNHVRQFRGLVGLRRRRTPRRVLRQHRRLRIGRRRRRIHILVIQQQRIHLVRQLARRTPRHPDDDHPLAHGPQSVDHVQKIGIPRHQHKSADVRVAMGAFDTIGGHLDVNAVLDPVSPHPVGRGRRAGRHPGRHEHRFDPGGVERRRVVDELAGPPQFRGAGHPVGIGFRHHHPPLLRNLLPQRRQVRRPVAGRQTDLEIFPVNKQRDVPAAKSRLNHDPATSGPPPGQPPPNGQPPKIEDSVPQP